MVAPKSWLAASNACVFASVPRQQAKGNKQKGVVVCRRCWTGSPNSAEQCSAAAVQAGSRGVRSTYTFEQADGLMDPAVQALSDFTGTTSLWVQHGGARQAGETRTDRRWSTAVCLGSRTCRRQSNEQSQCDVEPRETEKRRGASGAVRWHAAANAGRARREDGSYRRKERLYRQGAREGH